MKLSDAERAVLEAAEFFADAPISEVARLAKVAPHVANNAIRRMINRGLIERRAYLDSYLLGTRPFMIFATIPAHRERSRKDFLVYLKKHPSISFVAEVVGTYNIWFELRSEEIFGIEEVLLEIAKRFGDILLKQDILAMPSHADFNFLLEERSRRLNAPYIETKFTSRSVSLDAIDFTILRALAKSWVSSQKALARELAIAPSTLSYRIDRMRRERLIVAARFWINREKLGGHRFAHLVSVRVPSEKLKSAFFQFAREQSGVFLLRSFLGRWNFLLETYHQKAEDVAEFTSALHDRFPIEIAERETLTVLTLSKTSDCTARRGA